MRIPSPKVEKNEVAEVEKNDSTVAVAVAVAGDLLPVQAEVASFPPPEREKVVSADITSVQADQTSVPQGGGEVAPRVVKQVGSTKPYPLIYSRRNKGGRAGLVVPEKSTVVPAGLAGEKPVEEGQMAVYVAEKPVKEGQLSVLGPEKPVPRLTYGRRKKTSDAHVVEKSVKEGQLSVLDAEKPVPRFTYSRRNKPLNQEADVSQAMDGQVSGVDDLLTRKPFLSDEPIDEPVEERQFEKCESYRSAETRKITPAAQAPETASGQEPKEK